jgi:ATP-binding protein involved in chromosome partitioning
VVTTKSEGGDGPARVVVAVASGKGGVGKSAVALNVAVSLAQRGLRVGLLDADLYGPDIPRMVGLTRRHRVKQWTVARDPRFGAVTLDPVERFGVKLASAGFLFGEDQALALASGMIEVLFLQLVRSTTWGDLDYLLVDLPPGTADLQQAVMNRLRLSGVVLVVTPQDVAHLDAKKVLTMLGTAGVPVLGAVENMRGLTCPCCDTVIEVFPPVPEEQSIWALGVERLGAVPLDPRLGRSSAAGRPVVVDDPDSIQATALRAIAVKLQEALG